MQVCVPINWTDKQIKDFADQGNICGTEKGWQIRKQGDKLLNGDKERVNCSYQKGYVHIMLDA